MTRWTDNLKRQGRDGDVYCEEPSGTAVAFALALGIAGVLGALLLVANLVSQAGRAL